MIEVKAPDEVFKDVEEGVEGLLEGWLVEEGEAVSAGQPLADAIVVKTSFQLYSPADGTITKILVEKDDTFAPGTPLAWLEEGEAGEPAAGAPVEEGQRVPFTGMRGAVARQMAAAWQEPRVAMGVVVDMTAALAALNGLSPLVAILRAVALTLPEHPRLNARLAEDGVEVVSGVNLGLAVSLDEGLIVPVIREADRKSMSELAEEVRELAEAARAGSLPGTALRDGTFTVSNLGATGIDWFTPILDAPQVAILGVGSVAEHVFARDGAPVVAPAVALTLVFSHRAVDGQPAATFLSAVRERLEEGAL